MVSWLARVAAFRDVLTVNPRFLIAAFFEKNAWTRGDAPQAYALPLAHPRAMAVILS